LSIINLLFEHHCDAKRRFYGWARSLQLLPRPRATDRAAGSMSRRSAADVPRCIIIIIIIIIIFVH
jgi:hypothetical protein